MIVGYARTSTVDQIAGFEAQSKELSAAGCEKIFREQVSSATVRLQLQSALKFVRNGDVFVVIKLDRLARSVAAANHARLRTNLICNRSGLADSSARHSVVLLLLAYRGRNPRTPAPCAEHIRKITNDDCSHESDWQFLIPSPIDSR